MLWAHWIKSTGDGHINSDSTIDCTLVDVEKDGTWCLEAYIVVDGKRRSSWQSMVDWLYSAGVLRRLWSSWRCTSRKRESPQCGDKVHIAVQLF